MLFMINRLKMSALLVEMTSPLQFKVVVLILWTAIIVN